MCNESPAIEDLALAIVPFNHLAVDIERRVNDAGLAIELAVQRAKAERHLCVQRFLHVEDRQAVGIFASEFLRFDQRLILAKS